jgi:hypothetical protein
MRVDAVIVRVNRVRESVVFLVIRSEGSTTPPATQLVPLIRYSSPIPWLGAIATSLVLWSLIIWAAFVALS